MSHAIVIGKFYPPHEGHHYLIQTAIDECDLVTIAVCWSSVENIDYEQRMAWIAEEHIPTDEDNQRIEIIDVFDDSPVEYTDETWEIWLDSLMDSLDWQGQLGYPDTIYSGEAYAEEFAQRLQKRYDERDSSYFPEKINVRMVDRAALPVSASMFRDDPASAWPLLRAGARAALCKRVVVCGGESTGTTTLANALGELHDVPVVFEYGRYYDQMVGKSHQWTDEDFWNIASKQNQIERDIARQSRNGLLICDTDAFATAMFSEVYLGHSTPGLLEYARETSSADLYIITSHNGIDFEDDGTRYNSGKRGWMTEWFRNTLPYEKTLTVYGDHQLRIDSAVAHINSLLSNWGIEEPLEYR